MDHRKLFQVLVLGGAMLGVGCVEAPAPGEDAAAAADDGAVAGGDAAVETDAATITPGVDSGGLVECGFCPNEECCEPDGAGGSRTREGLACCWSTSC